MSTIQLSLTSIFSTGSLRALVFENSQYSKVVGSHRTGRVIPAWHGSFQPGRSRVRNDLQAPLFQAISQAAERIDQLVELLVAEFGKNELVKRFLLGGEACQLLVGLVGQRHLHDSGVFGGCLAAKEALLLQKLRLRRNERRVDVKLLGNNIDGNAVLVVEIGERHQDHPLRTADSEGLCPEVAQFFQVNADRIDDPGKPSDGFLILWSRFAQSTFLACTEGVYNLAVLPGPQSIFVDSISKTSKNILYYR